jgi:hypothetical protein
MRGRLAARLAAALLGFAAEAARSEETLCEGSLGAISLGNLVVPDGARCKLRGTRMKGKVQVGGGATLDAKGIFVNGNVQSQSARSVKLVGSRIGGSVQLEQGGSASVTRNEIDGELQLESNRAKLVAAYNEIGGSLQAFQNTGGVDIKRNVSASVCEQAAVAARRPRARDAPRLRSRAPPRAAGAGRSRARCGAGRLPPGARRR